MITLQSAYLKACLLELEALKPGNVHIFADGHGMQLQDFIDSAEYSAPALCHVHPSALMPLGERIFNALQATHAKVGCNTNLGIVLLCAPIVQARITYPSVPLQEGIARVLANTTIDDAEQVFQGMRLVKPAGLGQRNSDDIAAPAQITLLAAMQHVETIDSIARQYCQAFADIWQATHLYEALCLRWDKPAWAASALYLYWLSHWPDSHIQRKFGKNVAQQVQLQAKQYYAELLTQTNPKLMMGRLIDWDQQLKIAQLNPGTSADLTVATIFLFHLFKGFSIT